ncbi:hypothetical protein SAMN05216371_0838 [Streptomyces sp. TLI_053]|nr:hypothetical protein SAMN05216371_0838 [Streptomyces sp. TLI_053]
MPGVPHGRSGSGLGLRPAARRHGTRAGPLPGGEPASPAVRGFSPPGCPARACSRRTTCSSGWTGPRAATLRPLAPAPQAARQGRHRPAERRHRQPTTQAGAFLTWLTHRGSTPATATQADPDAWHTENYATRRAAQPFLCWCMDTQRMPRLAIPYRATANPLPLAAPAVDRPPLRPRQRNRAAEGPGRRQSRPAVRPAPHPRRPPDDRRRPGRRAGRGADGPGASRRGPSPSRWPGGRGGGRLFTHIPFEETRASPVRIMAAARCVGPTGGVTRLEARVVSTPPAQTAAGGHGGRERRRRADPSCTSRPRQEGPTPQVAPSELPASDCATSEGSASDGMVETGEVARRQESQQLVSIDPTNALTDAHT